MKVIFLQNIASLGQKGDIKDVSDGYATNFLLPQNKAVLATEHNIAQLKAQQKKQATKIKEKLDTHQKIAATLNKQTINFFGKVSDKDTLFKGIGVKDIIEAVHKNFNLETQEKWFRDSAVIKKLGRHEVFLILPDNKRISFYINIKAEEN
ncbi:50S ribosomal protein L9 [Candidatus Parcubacteria bacterium]|nr:MAG: 50S ribosomal protein L9 [Candidatus Parcubacteria bacterium]